MSSSTTRTRTFRRAAASSLGDIRDVDSLDRIIELLGLEQGEVPSPFAAAATFIAYELAPDRQHEVLDRLHEFAGKGATAALQVTELAWVLDEGNPPQH